MPLQVPFYCLTSTMGHIQRKLYKNYWWSQIMLINQLTFAWNCFPGIHARVYVFFGFENLGLLQVVYDLRKLLKRRKNTYTIWQLKHLFCCCTESLSRLLVLYYKWVRNKLLFMIYNYMLHQSNTKYKWMKEIIYILDSVGQSDNRLNLFSSTIPVNKIIKLR